MGAKPNRKSRHGLHVRKARFPAGTIFPKGRLVMDFETQSHFPLYPHQRDLLDAMEYSFQAFSRTGRKPSEPEMQHLTPVRYILDPLSALLTTDFSEAEMRAITQAGERLSAAWDKSILTAMGIDLATGPDKTGYSVFDPARYRKD